MAACNERYWVCDGLDEAHLAVLPSRLSEAGLYDDVKSNRLATGVRGYRPQFGLWSDGADKARWVSVPEGSRIDTIDMDDWRFAVGTRFWKEFTRNGVRLETRLMLKSGPADGDWVFMAYVWNDDESDALAAAYGAIDVRGTPHNVPAASECASCHAGRASRVLGFSAIQLAAPAMPGEIALTELATTGQMTKPPDRELVVPGDETERAALGYLHANCGECHNAARPPVTGARCFEPRNGLDVWLRTDSLASVQTTPTYQTIFDEFAERGDPDASRVIRRMSARGLGRMPCVGIERVDEEGRALLRRFIARY